MDRAVMHRALAIVALALGLGAMGFSVLQGRAAREATRVTALELGAWIKDHKPGLRVIDMRSQASYDEDHVPTAERVPLDALAHTAIDRDETIALYADDRARAAQGWASLQRSGYEHVYVLDGGLAEWKDQVMAPLKATDVSRYFGGVARTSGAAALKRRGGC